MFIVWGTKRTERKQGLVADFCPICREVRAFQLIRVGLASLVHTFIQMHLGPARFFRARILPSLVKSLKPLEPTREDLGACIDRCKTLGLKIGKVAKLDEVWAHLERRMAGFYT